MEVLASTVDQEIVDNNHYNDVVLQGNFHLIYNFELNTLLLLNIYQNYTFGP